MKKLLLLIFVCMSMQVNAQTLIADSIYDCQYSDVYDRMVRNYNGIYEHALGMPIKLNLGLEVQTFTKLGYGGLDIVGVIKSIDFYQNLWIFHYAYIDGEGRECLPINKEYVAFTVEAYQKAKPIVRREGSTMLLVTEITK